MFHRSCALCAAPAAAAVNLGPLLGPIRDSKSNTADDLFVHRICAVWSPEVSGACTVRCCLVCEAAAHWCRSTSPKFLQSRALLRVHT